MTVLPVSQRAEHFLAGRDSRDSGPSSNRVLRAAFLRTTCSRPRHTSLARALDRWNRLQR